MFTVQVTTWTGKKLNDVFQMNKDIIKYQSIVIFNGFLMIVDMWTKGTIVRWYIVNDDYFLMVVDMGKKIID